MSQPLSVNYFSQAFSNGVIFADQFCGLGTIGGITTAACSADICTKLQAANQYAVNNGVTLVDVTHAQGTQACSANPYSGLNSTNNATVNLTDNFGNTHFQTSVQWVVTNSGIVMHGMGPYSTQVEYTGGTLLGSVLLVNQNNGTGGVYAGNGLTNFELDGMFFYGGTSNATDAIDLNFVNRSKLMDVYTWGATTCGIRNAAVTDTFYRPTHKQH